MKKTSRSRPTPLPKQWANLDFDYLRKWAPELGVATGLEEVRRIAEESQARPSP